MERPGGDPEKHDKSLGKLEERTSNVAKCLRMPSFWKLRILALAGVVPSDEKNTKECQQPLRVLPFASFFHPRGGNTSECQHFCPSSGGNVANAKVLLALSPDLRPVPSGHGWVFSAPAWSRGETPPGAARTELRSNLPPACNLSFPAGFFIDWGSQQRKLRMAIARSIAGHVGCKSE